MTNQKKFWRFRKKEKGRENKKEKGRTRYATTDHITIPEAVSKILSTGNPKKISFSNRCTTYLEKMWVITYQHAKRYQYITESKGSI